MKRIISKIIEFYNKGDNKFYFSLFGPITMGTIHLIASIIHFDWIVVNYCMFSYSIALFKLWQWLIEKYNIKPNNLMAGIISVFIIIIPMMVSFVMTILYREAPHYIFDWIIYAYAFYGTIKMVFAIKSIIKKDKSDKEYVLSFIGMISALYTIQMMEFSLVTTFGDGGPDSSMFLMQLFTQGAIFIFSIVVIILFVKKYISDKHKLNV